MLAGSGEAAGCEAWRAIWRIQRGLWISLLI
jgi:hypothetical protein